MKTHTLFLILNAIDKADSRGTYWPGKQLVMQIFTYDFSHHAVYPSVTSSCSHPLETHWSCQPGKQIGDHYFPSFLQKSTPHSHIQLLRVPPSFPSLPHFQGALQVLLAKPAVLAFIGSFHTQPVVHLHC